MHLTNDLCWIAQRICIGMNLGDYHFHCMRLSVKVLPLAYKLIDESKDKFVKQ